MYCKVYSGATYIIWGRKQCPNNNTELVYSGYAGGGHYTDKGAAVEYVCLPPDPSYVKASGKDEGRMYGAEFYTNFFFASDGAGEDVPCALCRTNHANTAVMTPGKNTCYSGWEVEYHGYFSSGYYGNDAATTYVCVDIKPEYLIGGVNQNLSTSGHHRREEVIAQ
ncbi:short-chain collagen C4-like [Mytilus californianus]|uniref:short-chain collagen C4-like n=1 Tax=Mytilus californianus TaxID=6549 RepID=UPI0022460DBF|nr:short-chain collagen C4-like [Mytilus californianus]